MDNRWEIIKFVDATYAQCCDAVKSNPQAAMPYVLERYPSYAVNIISTYMDKANYVDHHKLTYEFLDGVVSRSTIAYANILLIHPECYHKNLFIKASRKYTSFISSSATLRFIKAYAGIDDVVHQMLAESLPKINQPQYILYYLYSYNLERFISEELIISVLRQPIPCNNTTQDILDIYLYGSNNKISARLNYELLRHNALKFLYRAKICLRKGRG